jgi:hypothetical protein
LLLRGFTGRESAEPAQPYPIVAPRQSGGGFGEGGARELAVANGLFDVDRNTRTSLSFREQFAAEMKQDSNVKFPILSDVDNGYAMSLNLAIWVGSEMEEYMTKIGRKLPQYQGNDSWMLPIPAEDALAAFVVVARSLELHARGSSAECQAGNPRQAAR